MSLTIKDNIISEVDNSKSIFANKEINVDNNLEKRKEIAKQYILDNFEVFFKKFLMFVFAEIEHKPLLWSWHLSLMSYEIYLVLSSKSKKVIWNLPPGSTKTDCMICLVCLYMAFYPNTRMILVAGAESVRDKYIDYIKRILRHNFYRNLFPNVEIDENRSETKEKFYIKGGVGFFKVFSTGDKITGEDCDYLLLDDVIDYGRFQQRGFQYVEKINKLIVGSLLGRLRQQSGEAIVNVIMQRICEMDTTEYMLKVVTQYKWRQLSIPAICDEKKDIYNGKYGIIYEYFNKKIFFEYGKIFTTFYDKNWYDGEKKRFLGFEKDFYYQYHQKNLGSTSKILSLEKIRKYDEIDYTKSYIKLMSVDCASGIEGADRTAITIWLMDEDTNVYLKQIYINQYAYEDLLNFVIDIIEREKIDISIIEFKMQGISLVQDLEKFKYGRVLTKQERNDNTKMLFNPIVPITPIKNKEYRLIESNTYIELGKVYFPKEMQGNTEFLTGDNKNVLDYGIIELINFGAYPHDDFCDSCSMSWSYIKSRFYKPPKLKAEEIVSYL